MSKLPPVMASPKSPVVLFSRMGAALTEAARASAATAIGATNMMVIVAVFEDELWQMALLPFKPGYRELYAS